MSDCFPNRRRVFALQRRSHPAREIDDKTVAFEVYQSYQRIGQDFAIDDEIQDVGERSKLITDADSIRESGGQRPARQTRPGSGQTRKSFSTGKN
jgi:hypothetical protein